MIDHNYPFNAPAMYNSFVQLYPLQKTLRFSLLPVNETLENIHNSKIIEHDTHRAESYQKVKRIIDNYHKSYIEETLVNFTFASNEHSGKGSLEEFSELYTKSNRTDKEKERLELVQRDLRKQISDKLTSGDKFKRINKDKLIKEDLFLFVKTEEEKRLLNEFKNFTTYFTGFHENRQNMYSAEAKSTAIAHRLIHDNLPKFIDNILTFKQFTQIEKPERLSQINNSLSPYLQIKSIETVFTIDFFNKLLTQPGIDKYNALIGGITLEDGTHIKGLNGYVNEYNQIHNRASRLPKFKQLYKQILSDRNTLSWLPESFSSDEEVLEAIERYYIELDTQILSKNVPGEHSLKQLLKELVDYDLDRIYVANDTQLSHISQKVFGHWSMIQNALSDIYIKNYPQGRRESVEKFNERVQKFFKRRTEFSIAEIENALQSGGIQARHLIANHFANPNTDATETETATDLFDYIAQCHDEAKDLLNIPYPKEKHLTQDKNYVSKIKKLLDAIKSLQHFVSPMAVPAEIFEKDENFYGEFSALYEILSQVTPLYNMVRNYMTKKPYSTEKIKLNFNNPSLLNGWDLNKERDNTAIILRKENLYYLGIMDKKWNKIFEKDKLPSSGKCFDKMVYKLLPNAERNLPRIFFSKKRIHESQPSHEILRIRQCGSFKKGDSFKIEDCRSMIDFYKASIAKHEDWKNFNFHFSPTETYNDISEFYKEVEKQGYKISFQTVSEDYIYNMVKEGKLYLFQIYNKDFSSYSKGKPNIHTIYWKMLFDERNLADVVYKLNGEAEVFFRKASLHNDKPTHPAKTPLKNKNPLTKNKESIFDYDLIKDKRFTLDHFEFHVPITMNFKGRCKENINELANDYIRKNKNIHIIGIDRGERNLLYFVMIDQHGKIVPGMQFSLNKIGNTDYHKLLEIREDERQRARQSWDTIEGIKNLKEGYLSIVIHEIATAMIRHNAIVVLEDLNFGFKRGRQKVEKQVYQKFEQMLIDKLNYLIDKEAEPNESGGALKAYQLTSKFESFQKIGKQSGFLFYVPAWNTSKIDPVTGFANLFDTKYESVEKTKDFLNKFDTIQYNPNRDWFEFTFDYSKFTTKADGSRKTWTACSTGNRIHTFRNPDKNNNWDNRELQVTAEFKRLFNLYNIDYRKNLKKNILSQADKTFFYNEKANQDSPLGLLQLFNLMLQMRNSITNTEIDYLISPIADENGFYFDSRHADENLPQNADANGAYNIARKGLWMLEKIRSTPDEQLKLAMSNKDWLQFAQEKPYLK